MATDEERKKALEAFQAQSEMVEQGEILTPGKKIVKSAHKDAFGADVYVEVPEVIFPQTILAQIEAYRECMKIMGSHEDGKPMTMDDVGTFQAVVALKAEQIIHGLYEDNQEKVAHAIFDLQMFARALDYFLNGLSAAKKEDLN